MVLMVLFVRQLQHGLEGVNVLFFPSLPDLGGKLPFEAGISLFLGAEYEDFLQKNAVSTIIAQCRKPQFITGALPRKSPFCL